jgi:hypothetical protein
LDGESFFLKWLKVFLVETGADFSCSVEAGSCVGLFRMTDDKDRIVGEIVSSLLGRGEGREEKAPDE